MWDIQKGEKYDKWSEKKCLLIIEHSNNKCTVWVNYKGFNVIMPMGMWGFEEEMIERNIQYEVAGDKGDFMSIRYAVANDDLRVFAEMVSIFLKENNLVMVLNDAFKL